MIWVSAKFTSATPLDAFRSNDDEAGSEHLTLMNRCKLSLLEAGADPNDYDDDHYGYVKHVVDSGTTVTPRIFNH